MLAKILNKFKDTGHLKNLITESPSFLPNNLNYYSIVFILMNDKDEIKKAPIPSLELEITMVFTQKNSFVKSESYNLIPIMLGVLIKRIQAQTYLEVIGINFDTEISLFDELIFIPLFDKTTQLNLISPPNYSLALLSIDQTSHKNLGLETIFLSISDKHLNKQNQSQDLKQISKDIDFILPRILQPKGSGNVIVLLLNLDDYLEERALIREYKTFIPYIEVLFVTSELKLLTGNLTEISYDPSTTEGIYLPIIQRTSS